MSIIELTEARVVEPVLDHAAIEQARLVNAARAALLKSGTSVTVEAIATAVDKDPGTVRRWIGRQRDAGRLVTVTHENQVLVPSVQLDDAFDLDPEVAKVIERLVAHGMDGWAVWHWLETPDTWLDGDTPSERIQAGDLAAVHHAVDGMFQE